MSRLSLFVARTALTAWVGAAILFVVVGVSEVVHSGFSSEIRDQLVVIRFPWYYRFGIVLMAAALAGTLGATGRELSPRRRGIAISLIAIALLIFTMEYFTVYLTLADLVTPPGKPRTPEFMRYHQWSMWINLGNLILCLAAASLLNWPTGSNSAERNA